MKSKFQPRIGAVVAVLFATGYAGIAMAHTQKGVLGKRGTASDIYAVSCPNPNSAVATHLEVAIQDLAPVKPPSLTVVAQFGSISSGPSTDSKDGDVKASPSVSANGGAGTYKVTVSKTAKPGKPKKSLNYPEIYNLDFHCITGTEHTETNIGTLQNQ